MRRVPILTYHALGDRGSVISTSPREFRCQMEALADSGVRGVTVGEVVALLGSESQFPTAGRSGARGHVDGPEPDRGPDGHRVVGLSFDDGYRSVLDLALPVLRDLGFRATVFAVTGRCGGDNRWPGQPSSIPTLPLLDWQELGRLVDEGWEIGSHGRSHSPLDRLAADRIEHEVAGSRRDIRDRLGIDARLFAYPYGRRDTPSVDAVRRRYQAACTAELAVAEPDHDRCELPRIDAHYLPTRHLETLLWRAPGRAYLALRRRGRQLHRALAGWPGGG